MKFIHLSAHLSPFSNQARPPSVLQHVYCILILLTFLVIFFDNFHVMYPLPIECAPCILSLLIQLFPCTTGSLYLHLTHWTPTFAQFVLRLIPRLPLACPVVCSYIYPFVHPFTLSPWALLMLFWNHHSLLHVHCLIRLNLLILFPIAFTRLWMENLPWAQEGYPSRPQQIEQCIRIDILVILLRSPPHY